jgi:hypothetical protein
MCPRLLTRRSPDHALAAAALQVLQGHCLDVLLRQGLLPASLGEAQGASLWVDMYAASSSQERDALLKFVSFKSQLQVGGRAGGGGGGGRRQAGACSWQLAAARVGC